jgi:hypothetical protein
MFGRLFGKGKADQQKVEDDEAVSVHWSQLWPDLGRRRSIRLNTQSLVEPTQGARLKDDAAVCRYGMFARWPLGTNFEPEPIGDVGIRLHALPRKYDHTGKPDLTNCIGLIVLKNPRANGFWTMLYDYQYGLAVFKGSPENIHGEPVAQKYREKSRSFYFAQYNDQIGMLELENMNWAPPANERITLGV